MLSEQIRSISSTTKDLRQFGLTVGIAFVLLGGGLFWLGKSLAPYLLILGVLLVFLSLVLPKTLKPFQKIWMTFAVIMGWIMTHIILTLLFFLMVMPLGLLMRLFRSKQLFDRRLDPTAKTYWIQREETSFDKTHYERQF